ncbi:bile acid:sodium symporter [Streptomyces pactum]|uniref:Bile acid:sodium symporter n=1 Tax=Streptomyces pactum TaxID=68249 RepID=A0ABS0NRC9_9ACTN|nr:bile acid:sodium symporter family protein [Streptomyces pactum]MBH5337763.1 bile acid:sodium symporter [Streptomyces pactum]
MNRRVLTLPARLPVDGYVLALLGTVLLAAVLPAAGRTATPAEHAATGAVAFVFFLYGARLSTAEALAGMRQWRLHTTVVLCTFVAFPLLGLAAAGLAPWLLTDRLATGVLFLCLVPSTIQSSITFTSIAGGNVAAAVCAGSFSSLLGVVLTPLLAAALLSGGAGAMGDGLSTGALTGVALHLLAPFLAGQVLRRRVGPVVSRHRKALGYADRGAILLVVYVAFSAGTRAGVWRQISPPRLSALLAVEVVLLAVMLALTWYGSRWLGFARADRITVLFAGSKKSLAAGLPMASVLFGAEASWVVLPLMLFHQLQLMVCAVLAGRLAARSGPQTPAATGTDQAAGAGGTGGALGAGGTAGATRATGAGKPGGAAGAGNGHAAGGAATVASATDSPAP